MKNIFLIFFKIKQGLTPDFFKGEEREVLFAS